MNNKAKSTLELFEKKLRFRNYSENTIKTYKHYTKEFLTSYDCDAYHIPAYEAKKYLEDYKYTSVSKQNQVISSVKLFYKDVLGSKIRDLKIVRPRKEKRLPRVVDASVFAEKIKSVKNKKHKAILALGLSCGLRVSEVVNLRASDIDSQRMIINVRCGKGRKDRIVPLSKALLNILREYYKEYKPKEFLFNGQFSKKYSVSSCGKIVKKHLGNDSHFHLLRHSSLSSMLETGTDVAVIQRVAGHSNITTTQGYLHVSTKFLKQIQTPI